MVFKIITHHSEIAKVPRLGNKTFEQSIGFLRILDGSEPLDKTAIHPESYEAAYALIQYVGLQKEDIGSDILKEKLNKLDIQDCARLALFRECYCCTSIKLFLFLRVFKVLRT